MRIPQIDVAVRSQRKKVVTTLVIAAIVYLTRYGQYMTTSHGKVGGESQHTPTALGRFGRARLRQQRHHQISPRLKHGFYLGAPHSCLLRIKLPINKGSTHYFLVVYWEPGETNAPESTSAFGLNGWVKVIKATDPTMVTAAISTRGVKGSAANKLPMKMAISGLT